MSETELRRVVADVCRRIYEKGFVAANDGNVSARLGGGRFLMTPSGVSKGDVTPGSLLVCDMNGKKLRGKGKLTTETLMHLTVYRERADVGAAIHSHAPYATALTLAGVALDAPVFPEVLVHLGRIPTAAYATPASAEGARAVVKLIRRHDAMLLEGNGTLTAGRDPWDAYYKLERVEHSAMVVFLARLLGRVRRLTKPEIGRLVAALALHGVTARIAKLRDAGGEE